MSALSADANAEAAARPDAKAPDYDSSCGEACATAPNFALSFDGNQVARASASVTDDFTIEMWVKTSTSSAGSQYYDGAMLFDAKQKTTGNDFGAAIVGDKFAFGTGNPDVTAFSTKPVTTGVWLHVAATRTRSTGVIQILIDGVVDATLATGNKGSLSDAQPPWIGGFAPHGMVMYPFVGQIDEVRVWNVVRSPSEISQAMHYNLRGDEPALVTYWRFDEGKGTIAADSSPAGNQALLGAGYADLIPTWIASDAPVE